MLKQALSYVYEEDKYFVRIMLECGHAQITPAWNVTERSMLISQFWFECKRCDRGEPDLKDLITL